MTTTWPKAAPGKLIHTTNNLTKAIWYQYTPVCSGKNGEYSWFLSDYGSKVYFKEHDPQVHGSLDEKRDGSGFREDWRDSRKAEQRAEDQRAGEAEQQRIEAEERRAER